MKITQVFNNNVVLVCADKGEMVVLGTGIGFRKKAGHSMDKIPLEGWQQFRFLYKWRYREYLDCEVEYC